MPISAEYLSGEYHRKNPTFHVEDSPWKARQIRALLSAHGIEPRRVVEVGCGAGEILVQLATMLPNTMFEGFEMGPQAFELCKQRISDRVRFHREDFTTAETPQFDLVMCIDVFEHIEDYFSFLRSIRTKGSAFVFHIPLDMNVQMVLRSSPLLMVRKKVGHLHYFSKDTAIATLHDCGYRIGSWRYTPNGVERPTSGKARVLRLPRKTFFALHKDLTVRILGGYSLLVYALPVAE